MSSCARRCSANGLQLAAFSLVTGILICVSLLGSRSWSPAVVSERRRRPSPPLLAPPAAGDSRSRSRAFVERV